MFAGCDGWKMLVFVFRKQSSMGKTACAYANSVGAVMTEKISISINLTKKRIVAIVLAVYFCLLGASYFGLHRAQDDWRIAYLRWDQATLISGEIGDIKALKASLKEAGARPEASGYSSPPDTNSLLIWDVWITWWNTRKSYYAVNDETEQHLDYTDAVLNDQCHLEQNKSE